jgi:AAA15 family ATPase/GTPase
MLISFTVENFLSFCDKQEVNFTPEALKEHKEYLHIPYLYDSKARVLKSIAVYGHNSFGKSNLIKAYAFFLKTIFSSFEFGKNDGFIDVDYFKLNTTNRSKPSLFEAVFILRDIEYSYGFKILEGKVIEEGLWYAEPKIRKNYLFQRTSSEIVISKNWAKESERIAQSLVFTKPHHLFLSVLFSQENIPRLQPLLAWFRGNLVMSGSIDNKHLQKALMILTQAEYRSTVQKFIENADVGFKTIVEKIDSQSSNKLKLDKNFLPLLFSHQLSDFEIYTEHEVYNEKMELESRIFFELLKSESSGSVKYLVMACYLTFAIKNGQLIWIDEFDSSLHLLLLKTVIQVFNSNQINVIGSQMVFTLHNTALLNNRIFRRDQIYVADKDCYGRSSLQRMHTKKNPIRKDAPIEKNYLEGNIGVSDKLKDKGNLLF